MSSLTIDELKRVLTEQGIPLPPSGAKKAEYVKLYEQHTLSDALVDTYSSDEETSKTGSQSVSSSSSPGKIDAISKEVEQLSNDELFNKLKELGLNIGPVLQTTRRIYEKKLINLLISGWQTNGYDTTNSNKETNHKTNEFSDSEIEIIETKKVDRKDYLTSKSRDSPKPDHKDSHEHKSHSYASKFDTKEFSKSYTPEVRRSKISFIETIPKGSSERYIEPTPDSDYRSSSTLRSRIDKSSYGSADYYRGTWQPNISQYSYGGSSQLKTGSKEKVSTSNWGKYIAILLFIALLSFGAYGYFYLGATDPYKEIEEEAAQATVSASATKN